MPINVQRFKKLVSVSKPFLTIIDTSIETNLEPETEFKLKLQ